MKPGYVFKKTGEPYFRDYPERTREHVLVALVESVRVNGKPRTRLIRSLGGFNPHDPPKPSWWRSRKIMENIRGLDIPLVLKKRFLKEIEARGVQFAWPKTLRPMTPEEKIQQEEVRERESKKSAAEIRALMSRIRSR
jgi:hypothetical protein